MLNHNKVYNPLSNYNKAISKLSSNGIRPTKQRMILAKLLFEKGKRHISAEDLFDEVREEDTELKQYQVIYTSMAYFDATNKDEAEEIKKKLMELQKNSKKEEI